MKDKAEQSTRRDQNNPQVVIRLYARLSKLKELIYEQINSGFEVLYDEAGLGFEDDEVEMKSMPMLQELNSKFLGAFNNILQYIELCSTPGVVTDIYSKDIFPMLTEKYGAQQYVVLTSSHVTNVLRERYFEKQPAAIKYFLQAFTEPDVKRELISDIISRMNGDDLQYFLSLFMGDEKISSGAMMKMAKTAGLSVEKMDIIKANIRETEPGNISGSDIGKNKSGFCISLNLPSKKQGSARPTESNRSIPSVFDDWSELDESEKQADELLKP